MAATLCPIYHQSTRGASSWLVLLPAFLHQEVMSTWWAQSPEQWGDSTTNLAVAGLRPLGCFPCGPWLCVPISPAVRATHLQEGVSGQEADGLGHITVSRLRLPYDPASNQWAKLVFKCPTVHPTKGNRREVPLAALHSLKPGHA